MAHITHPTSFPPSHLTTKPTIIAMPRIVQPGGITGQMHVRYTARRKLALLAAAKWIQEEEELSLCQAAECLMVSQSLFSRWQKQCTSRDDPIWALLMSRKKANLTGPLGQLKPLEDILLCFIIEQREHGINVNALSLVVKASSLSPEFNVKSFAARTSAPW